MAVSQNLQRLFVLPVVDNVLHDVSVTSAWHRFKEAATNCFAPSFETSCGNLFPGAINYRGASKTMPCVSGYFSRILVSMNP